MQLVFCMGEDDDDESTAEISDDFDNIFTRLRDLFIIPVEVNIEQFISVDDRVQVAGEFTDSDILQQVAMKEVQDSDDGSGNDNEPEITSKETLIAARTLQKIT